MYSFVLAALEPNTLIQLQNQSFCLNFVLIASNILTTHCSMLVQQYGMPKNKRRWTQNWEQNTLSENNDKNGTGK